MYIVIPLLIAIVLFGCGLSFMRALRFAILISVVTFIGACIYVLDVQHKASVAERSSLRSEANITNIYGCMERARDPSNNIDRAVYDSCRADFVRYSSQGN